MIQKSHATVTPATLAVIATRKEHIPLDPCSTNGDMPLLAPWGQMILTKIPQPQRTAEKKHGGKRARLPGGDVPAPPHPKHTMAMLTILLPRLFLTRRYTS